MKTDDYNILVESDSLYTGILLSTLWNQSGNIKIDGKTTSIKYNEYCPVDLTDNKKSLTGCTNTAAAQIIHYYIEKKDLDLQLTLTADDEYYSSYNGNDIHVASDGSTDGTLSFSEINALLSSYSCTSPEDIAALAYACGVVQEASYSSSATSTAWHFDLFYRAGFDCVNTFSAYSSSSPLWGSKGNISDAGFEVLIENLAAGQVIGTSYPGHALVIDGYDSENDMFHINFGWGNSSSTRWYTRSEINEKEYYYFLYDLNTDSDYAFTVNDTDMYGTGTILRAAELANGTTGENLIKFSPETNGKSVKLQDEIYLKKDDVRINGCDMDLLFDNSTYGFYSYNDIGVSIENFTGSLIVNSSSSSYQYGFYTGSSSSGFSLDTSGALIYSGCVDGCSAEDILETMKDIQSNEADVEERLLADTTYSIYASSSDDTVTLTDNTIVFGNISLRAGDDTLSVYNNSVIYGDVSMADGNNSICIDSSSSINGQFFSNKNSDTTNNICFELTDHNTNAIWTNENIYNLYYYATITVDLYNATAGVYTLLETDQSQSTLSRFNINVIGSGSSTYTLNCNDNFTSDHAELFVEDNFLKMRVKDYSSSDKTAPTLPGTPNADVEHDQATISWGAASDNIEVHHYELRYGQSSNLTGESTIVKNESIKLSGLKNGTYYYQLRSCDASGNTSSWTSVKSFNIMSDKADLRIVDYKVNSTEILTNQSLKLDFKVENNGYKNAKASVLSIYDGNVKLGQLSIKALSNGKSQSCSYTVAAGKLSEGSHKIYLVADSGNVVSEGNENNNKAYRTINVSIPRPDLCIKNYEVSSTDLQADGSVKLSFKYSNKGSADAGATKLKVYDGNTLLRTFDMGALRAGQSRDCTVTLKGSEIASGSRKIYLVADAADNAAESDENNNKAYRTITRLTPADLCIENYQVSSTSVTTQENVKLSFKITNNGQSTAPGTKLYVYDGNTKLREYSIGSITGNASRTCTVTLKGSELALGSRKIYLVTDAANNVAESNEGNNKAYRTIKVNTPADMCIKDCTVNSTVISTQGTLRLNFKLSNKGGTDAGATKLKVYDGSTLLRTFDMGTVGAGQSRDCTVTLKGSELALGSRKIYLVADAADNVAESNEENNRAYRTIQVNTPADMCIENYTLNSSAVSRDGSVKLSSQYSNKGETDAGATKLKVYDGNTLLRTFDMGALGAGQSRDCTVTLKGSEIASGSRKIYLVADAANNVAESNEENNKAYRTIKVNTPADMCIENYTLNSSAVSRDGSVKLSFQYSNKGETDAGATKLKVYDGNTLLRTFDMGALGAGQSRDCTVTLKGSELALGSRKIYLVADAANNVTESNEENNKAYRTVTVEESNVILADQNFVPELDAAPEVSLTRWQSDGVCSPCSSLTDDIFDTGKPYNIGVYSTPETLSSSFDLQEDPLAKNKPGFLA